MTPGRLAVPARWVLAALLVAAFPKVFDILAAVGIGAVEGSSSRQARKGGHSRPDGAVSPSRLAVSRICSVTAVISGEALA